MSLELVDVVGFVVVGFVVGLVVVGFVGAGVVTVGFDGVACELELLLLPPELPHAEITVTANNVRLSFANFFIIPFP
ncbi:hypothetical protein [Mannheimia granulomatis]|uniref:hypothetical protein n=1 Tax=Mannheimia granulomatis TaxID=85402 RepID=UPI001405108B|nr:hypothetical protein [Mannheimia granulomatis]